MCARYGGTPSKLSPWDGVVQVWGRRRGEVGIFFEKLNMLFDGLNDCGG